MQIGNFSAKSIPGGKRTVLPGRDKTQIPGQCPDSRGKPAVKRATHVKRADTLQEKACVNLQVVV